MCRRRKKSRNASQREKINNSSNGLFRSAFSKSQITGVATKHKNQSLENRKQKLVRARRLKEQQFSMRKRENVWTCLRKNADGLHKEQLTRARRSTVKKQETHAEGLTANENEERRGCDMHALFARRGAQEAEIINRNKASDSDYNAHQFSEKDPQ